MNGLFENSKVSDSQNNLIDLKNAKIKILKKDQYNFKKNVKNYVKDNNSIVKNIKNVKNTKNESNKVDQRKVDRLSSYLKCQFHLIELDLDFFQNYFRWDLEVSSIIVPKNLRKQGIGTQVMLKIIEFADQHNLRLILSPDSKNNIRGTTSENRLIRFYKRFGFVENKGRNKDYSLSARMFRPLKK